MFRTETRSNKCRVWVHGLDPFLIQSRGRSHRYPVGVEFWQGGAVFFVGNRVGIEAREDELLVEETHLEVDTIVAGDDLGEVVLEVSADDDVNLSTVSALLFAQIVLSSPLRGDLEDCGLYLAVVDRGLD